jgi:hypothetical protein
MKAVFPPGPSGLTRGSMVFEMDLRIKSEGPGVG